MPESLAERDQLIETIVMFGDVGSEDLETGNFSLFFSYPNS